MTIKTRDFYNLSDDDFMRWSDEAAIWFTEHHADPNHAPMDLDFELLATAFALALQDYKNKKAIAEARTREIAPPSKQLRDLMLALSRMLPTLFDGDENVLAEFSLTTPITTDDDLLLIAARSCRDRWDVVKLEPEYAPLTFLFDQVAVLVTALEDARDAAQNTKDVALEAAVKKAQAIFNWYRGLYVSPEDERWQATPFGATYGESGGGGEVPPAPENWDDPPTGLKVKEGPPGFANISAILHEDADGAGIYLVEGPLGVSAQPVMSPTPAEPKVPLPFGMPINVKVRSWIWVCAVKDGVLGQVTGPEWIERTL